MSEPGPGKFEGCESLELAEALYALVQDGGCDEEIGAVDENGWFGLLTVPWVDPPDLKYTGSQERFFIVSEDSVGFFDYKEFDSKEKMQKKWIEIATCDNEYHQSEIDEAHENDDYEAQKEMRNVSESMQSERTERLPPDSPPEYEDDGR